MINNNKPYIAVLVMILLIINHTLYSCSGDNRSTASKVKKEHSFKLNKFNDEDIFKGLVFLDGPVAELFDDFKELNFRNFVDKKEDVEQVISFQNLLISSIKKRKT